ncbi:MAG: hypothetical protein IKE01_00850 [Clostridia bacterium]|nr:hypothetical protein [Clostridia bacterium]
MKKGIIKNFLLVSGVAVLTVGMLTGCGKKNDETKTYDKENIAVNTNQTVVENKKDLNKLIKDEIESKKFLSENGIKEAGIETFNYRVVENGENPIYIVSVEYLADGQPVHGKIFQVYYANEKVNFDVIEDHKYMSHKVEFASNMGILRLSAVYRESTRQGYYQLNNGKFYRITDDVEPTEYKFVELDATDIEYNKAASNKTNEKKSSNADTDNNKYKFENLKSKEYVGEVSTTDSNAENPSFATTTYDVSFSESGVCKIVGKVQYKAKNATITINEIEVTSEEAAAGTSYVKFNFKGESDGGAKYTGTGYIGYSNVTVKETIKLELNFNEDVFNGVNCSVNGGVKLELKN